MTKDQMINIVNERVNLMVKDEALQKIMIDFKTSEEAQSWLIKAAIATLFIDKN
jgi:hypothetical protein